ncbi:MAG: SDR family NAD(P)-dependent oxidoreductase [Porcipelethomonas sp.]
MNLLKGKTAVVTGCSRGIGKAILENFAENGADIFAVIRKENPEFSEHCSRLMKENGVNIHIVYIDFESEESVKCGSREILAAKKPIDIMVNNVGVSMPLRSLAMTKMDTIREVFQVNLFSQLLMTQLISKNMMRCKKGSIIFISSSAAFDGGANIEYSASKAAVIGSVRRLALELAPYGIRVNAVAPGLTDTDMGNSMSEEDEKIALSMNIMHRKGMPREIADAVLFLASDMASFITRQVLRVDGGLL